MKLVFARLSLITAGLLVASQALAFSDDDKSMNTPSGAAKFSDPDEQTPGGALHLQGGKAQSGDVDPSSIRYDYDPTSGSYLPHKQ
jgi:hypothetical protein